MTFFFFLNFYFFFKNHPKVQENMCLIPGLSAGECNPLHLMQWASHLLGNLINAFFFGLCIWIKIAKEVFFYPPFPCFDRSVECLPNVRWVLILKESQWKINSNFKRNPDARLIPDHEKFHISHFKKIQ